MCSPFQHHLIPCLSHPLRKLRKLERVSSKRLRIARIFFSVFASGVQG
jgi:hypothetical protein